MRRSARPALRLIALLGVLTMALGTVGVRLVQLQVVRAEPLELLGAKQRVRTTSIPAKRGAIFDRNLVPLAVSTQARDIIANPYFIDDPAAAARLLAPVIGRPEGEIEEALSRDAGYVYLRRTAPVPVADEAMALRVPGISTEPSTERSYPAGSVAGQVLGFVGTDGFGLAGVEVGHEDILAGTPGEEVVERDPTGRPIPSGLRSRVEPVPGRGLVLTIDREIQFFAESALARAARTTRARSGVAVVLDPATGDVLAMANWPPLDPAGFGEASPFRRRNRVVTDAYEPGSVNKVITAAAAIEDGIMTPSTIMSVPDRIRVSGRTFRDYEPHPTQRITYAEALARSSNVGTIKVALKLGDRRLGKALRAFGLGAATGIGFPGESDGILLPTRQWYGTSIATVPIGQGIAMTPLQLASVYGTIANGGRRMDPRLVHGVVERDGTVVEAEPARATRVVSRFTAAQVRAMLVGVVEEGTGTRAAIPGYLVGGKTGTARIPRTDRPGYSNDIITTFAGMAPADAPGLVVVTSLENPRPRFAALTVAPVFREIMAFALAKRGIQPTVVRADDGSLLARRAKAPAPPARRAPSRTPSPSPSRSSTTDGRTDTLGGIAP